MNKIVLGVHELVDFILRKGDINNRVFNSETMQEGSKIHSKFQKDQGVNYFSEVFLHYDFIYKQYIFSLKGRADGIIKNQNEVIIDEIKSTNMDLEEFFEQNREWHLGQSEIYGLIYCLTENIDHIKIRLTYISQNDSSILYKYIEYDKNELIEKVFSYFDKYLQFYVCQEDYILLRDRSLKNLRFPFFNIRKGQKEIIDIVDKNIKEKSQVFIEASTGIGKTIATIYGTVKNFNLFPIDTVFYLAAKNSGFLSALSQIETLNRNGLTLRAVQITSKEKICLNKNNLKKCNPIDCPFAKDYYSKIYDVIIYSIQNYLIFDKASILEIANKFGICPFELSLDLSNICDFVICDYNYVFHPISYLKRYFDNYEVKRNCVLLIDEAHNLIDRSRDMYSAELSDSLVKEAMSELNQTKKFKRLKNCLEDILESFRIYSYLFKENNDKHHEILLVENKLIKNLSKFDSIYKDLKKNDFLKKTVKLDELSLEVFTFLTIFDYAYEDNYKKYVKIENNSIILKLFCLDASKYIKERIRSSYSTTLFSATLEPIDYYKSLILQDTSVKDYHFSSPFDKENLKVIYKNDISLYYRDRERTIKEVINNLFIFLSYKVGNYIIFTPSFEYLNKIRPYFDDINYNIYFQEKGMSKEDKEDFLTNFKSNPLKTTVGVCVLGGSFSEGIDLKEDLLIGICVIGVGLPMVSVENNYLKEYFDSKGFNGFDYSFTNPGINKVMQAIGRLIRTENDRGAALLIDKRYSSFVYRETFQKVYENGEYCENNEKLSETLKIFYKNNEK